MRVPVSIAVEGPSDAAVAQRLLGEVGLVAGRVFGLRGKDALDARVRGFNAAANRDPWFVIRDLDHDGDCAPRLLPTILPAPSRLMCFRIAVREIEAWLLADRDQAALWLRVSRRLLPTEPDSIDDPKQTLVNLARRSRSREVRDDLVPAEQSTAAVGRGFSSQLRSFVTSAWRPSVAARSSPSLASCLRALHELSRRLCA